MNTENLEGQNEEDNSFLWVTQKELESIQKLHPDRTAENLVGLAFSGGGIRSATFGLGVLEALKKYGILKQIDYLSTVSGGGYIGAWLSANCKCSADRTQHSDEADWLQPEANWSESIAHLRRHSNYLSPNLSLLNADTWSMATIWLRNTLLVQLMIFLSMACLLLVPRILFSMFNEYSHVIEWNYATIIFFVMAAIAIAFNLFGVVTTGGITKAYRPLFSQLAVQMSCVLPLMLVSLGYTGILWEKVNPWKIQITAFSYGDIFISIKNDFLELFENFEGQYLIETPSLLVENNNALISTLLITYLSFSIHTFISLNKENTRLERSLISVLAPLPAFILFVAILAAIMYFFNALTIPPNDITQARWLAFVWGPPAVLCSFSVSINLLLGMEGRDCSEQVREWWSRFGAWIAIYAVVCLVIAIAAVYGPLCIEMLYYHDSWKALGASWIGTTLAGLLAGKSSATGGSDSKDLTTRIKEVVARAAPLVFIFGLLIAVSVALHLVITTNFESPLEPPQVSVSADSKPDGKQIALQMDAKSELNNIHLDIIAKQTLNNQSSPAYGNHWQLLTDAKFTLVMAVFFLCLTCLWILDWRIDINEFSLNRFYRNRLTRCYLGAARHKDQRNPNAFTGFDDADDIKLADLLYDDRTPAGPLHIINCALNLGGSTDLSLHTRHSNSFTLTPLACGSHYEIKRPNGSVEKPIGYVKTYIYGGYTNQPTLGQAISVSGAAASPNMGYHTSAPVAFLMTLFNARLGWWFPNPSQSDCQQPSPTSSLLYLLRELFGFANEKSRFLAISDGGHFENLAAYELVKRRCKVIIISDGECDPKLQFDGLATLIRMCEVDLKATISIDVSAIAPDKESGLCLRRCAIGTITYQDDPQNPSWLIYLKASMNGHEDTAMLQYKAAHPEFPHETTGDQFYAEDQFESYRSLGRDIAEKLFSKVLDENGRLIVDNSNNDAHMVATAKALSKIFSSSLLNQAQFIHHADQLMNIWNRLGMNEALKDLDKELRQQHGKDTPERAVFYLCSEMIQLMENVYLDLNFEDTWQHPDYKGWQELFVKWAKSPPLKETWELTQSTYGERFRSFWNRHLRH